MIEFVDLANEWVAAGTNVAIARVIASEGSGPRDSGSTMLIGDNGEVRGSVSGGCVENSVVAEARKVLSTGRPTVVDFGFSDEDAFAVGLTCGGSVRVFIERYEFTPTIASLRHIVTEGGSATLTTVTSGPDAGHKSLAPLASDSADTITAGTFTEVFRPPARLFICGATDLGAALCTMAVALRYAVTVCDAREGFATSARFPDASVLEVSWPHSMLERLSRPLNDADALCVLTHDNKFDVPAIMEALGSDVGYIGAMGSRLTTRRRNELLTEAGATNHDLMRVHAPIGLDLGGRSPAETAISILAEIISVRTGHNATPLNRGDGPIRSTGRRP